MLVDSPSLEPLCACETFNRKRAFVKSVGKSVAQVPVVGVASVFTPSKNRGNGYAGLMMRLLAKRLPEITGGKGYSVLYSDVGPTFYDKNGGWKLHERREVDVSSTMIFQDASEPTLINLEEAEECISQDVGLLREEMGCLDPEDTKIIQLIPQHEELEWAVIRGRQSSSSIKQSPFVGAKISDKENWGYILWFPEISEDSLVILRLREPVSDNALTGLLSAAVEEAKSFGLSKVKIWSPSPRLLTLLGVEALVPDEHLACILPLGDQGRGHWRSIERLGWC